jgi:peptidoglycan/LPS O-acetylase OafA/YrhL
MYFWHFVVLWTFARLDLGPDRLPSASSLQFLVLLAGVITGTVITSTITYRLIERPMIRIGRQLADKVAIGFHALNSCRRAYIRE